MSNDKGINECSTLVTGIKRTVPKDLFLVHNVVIGRQTQDEHIYTGYKRITAHISHTSIFDNN